MSLICEKAMNFVMMDNCIDANTLFLRVVSIARTKHVY